MAVFYIIDEGKSYLISASTPKQALDHVKEIKQKACKCKK